MLYRAILIFPDSAALADFITYLEVPGEVNGAEFTFVGNLTEEQIAYARTHFGAYVRATRIIRL